MIRLLALILLLAVAEVPFQPEHSAWADNNGFRYLRPPAVQFNNGKLSGELSHVPLKDLIYELLRKEGALWEIQGELRGQVSVSLDNLTIAQSIRKVLHSNNLNHVVIMDGTGSKGIDIPMRIMELIVFPDEEEVRFNRTLLTVNKENPALSYGGPSLPTLGNRSKVEVEPTVEITSRPIPDGNFDESYKAMKNFLERLLEEKQINSEEYNSLMGNMEKRKE